MHYSWTINTYILWLFQSMVVVGLPVSGSVNAAAAAHTFLQAAARAHLKYISQYQLNALQSILLKSSMASK